MLLFVIIVFQFLPFILAIFRDDNNLLVNFIALVLQCIAVVILGFVEYKQWIYAPSEYFGSIWNKNDFMYIVSNCLQIVGKVIFY